MDWASHSPTLDASHRARLADALRTQAENFAAGDAVFANIERLKQGAAAVVTGQQVVLFGGPLLTLLKAATAIRKAQDATKSSGREHVPIFWLASEDHDLAEVDQLALLSKTSVETLSLGLKAPRPVPVGALPVDGGSDEGLKHLEATLNQASELLAWAPISDVLRECYTPGATLASAFGRLLTKIFADYGLIVMDAASRDFHALGASVLQAALERADELEDALLVRSQDLEAAGYHAQVLVTADHSLLFLLDAETGARLPLRRTTDGEWKAGARVYTTAELLQILATEPERLSPNALLRPVFQDTILPTAAYIGGPGGDRLLCAVGGALHSHPRPRNTGPSAADGHAGRARDRVRHGRRTRCNFRRFSKRKQSKIWPSASAPAPCPSKASARSPPSGTPWTPNSPRSPNT